MGTDEGIEDTRMLITGVEGKRQSFWERILAWANSHQPRFPWRRPGDPYCVLIGELLLEKTMSPVVASQRFLRTFPSVDELLAADKDAVDGILEDLHLQRHRDSIFQLVRGLAIDGKGGLPCDSETLARITGLDRHHIKAVFCFGYGLPIAVVNGHVRRMLKRILAGSLPSQPSAGLIEAIAESLVSYRDPQTYNSVLLDLAELVCQAEAPACQVCPVSSICDSALSNPTPEGSPIQPSNRSLVKTG
jgi:A/G-specific adenine glycosylase